MQYFICQTTSQSRLGCPTLSAHAVEHGPYSSKIDADAELKRLMESCSNDEIERGYIESLYVVSESDIDASWIGR